jgi:hypothetical protein
MVKPIKLSSNSNGTHKLKAEESDDEVGTLGSERKVAGPGNARGRPPVVNDLLEECEICVGQQWRSQG